MDYRLRKLEGKSLEIIRDAKDKFKNLAVLQLDDEKSKVCLFLCRRAFFGKIPFYILQPDGIEEIKRAIKDNNLDALIVSANDFDSFSSFKDNHLLIIYPLSDWSNLDINLYLKEKNILVDQSVEKAVENPQINNVSEDSVDGRNKEKEEIMQRLRDLGYM